MKGLVFVCICCLLVGILGAQSWRWGGHRYEDVRTPRDIVQHSAETPTWTNRFGFEKDVLTFVRIRRDHSGSSTGGPWWTDTPDSDLNLSYRLQQMTSMKVDPNGLFMRLTEKSLADFPFIYMV